MAGPLDRAYVEITAELDTRQAQRAAQNAGRIVTNELTSGVRRAERTMAREGGRIADTVGTEIGEGLSDSLGDALDQGLRRDVNGRLRDRFGRFVDEGEKAGRDTGSSFGSGFTSGLESTLSSVAGIRLPTAGFALLGGALSAAAASAVQLAAALAPAVGVIATLPSGIGVLTAGLTTLQVATLGVGDAFEVAATGDAEEFEEVMEGLAPSVQSAAQAIRDLTPALDGLRDSVQNAFFQDFDDVMNELADTLLGPVTTGMTSVATAINGVIQGLTLIATSQEGVDFVTESFGIMAQIIERLQEPLLLLFSSLLNIGTAINEAFGAEAGAGLADLITGFAAFLDQAAATGQATQWVHDAIAVFEILGSVVGSVVGIIRSIGQAASETGGNVLGVFGEILGAMDEFLGSAEGQDVLVTLFSALNTVGDAFATVLGNIAPALPPIIDGLADILGAVAPLLGPLSELVGSVLSALAPLLNVVASAIRPLIDPLTRIIDLLGGILVDAINTAMPLIELLVGLLGDQLAMWLEIVAAAFEAVAPVVNVLLEALGPLIEALEPLFALLGVIADLVGTVLEPVISVLGTTLLWLAETVIVPVLVPILEFLIQLLTVALADAIMYVKEQFELAGDGIAAVFNFVRDRVRDRVQAISQAWDNTVSAFTDGVSDIKDDATSLVNAIKAIPGKISSSLSNLFSPLASGFKSTINSVISGWNSLSFTVPSIDLGSLGSIGGFTVSTPNIPYLARGALATGPTLAMVGEGHGPEAILPLEDPRVTDLLAAAIGRAGLASDRTVGADTGMQQGGAASIGDLNVIVRVGERELTDIVVEQIDASNRTMVRRARAATRRS